MAELLDVDDPLVPELVGVLLVVVDEGELEPVLSVVLFGVVVELVEDELFEPFEDRESLR
ncbi:hypothetical protein GCM10025864_25290 [Luteimicrobium album]|uniref:Uncharacterized protein n=1 Tax=Luteimicrobium album TaxID=1054550 RepID=A0ABQ6I2M6_9MICO|nr:hypothetical protein GCM10025864_25290 [Luteimicrobium album]